MSQRKVKMMVTRFADFDLNQLHAAMDEKRRAGGLHWEQVIREISQRSGPFATRGLSRLTVTGVGRRTTAEIDSILQMLRWLERSPESFMPGFDTAQLNRFKLPSIPPEKVLRFDTERLYNTLNEQRMRREMTWRQVAREIGGVHGISLSHLSKGKGRIGFPHVMRLTAWLGCPAAQFTRSAER